MLIKPEAGCPDSQRGLSIPILNDEIFRAIPRPPSLETLAFSSLKSRRRYAGPGLIVPGP